MKFEQRHIFAAFILSIVLCGFAIAQNIVLSDPQPQSDGTIKISWTMDSENGVGHYEIYRSTSKDGQFMHIGDRKCGEFEFKDTGLFKSTIKYFCYKVLVIGTDGTVRIQSDIKGTSYNEGTSSSAKRTWGSIKAMFRY